MAVAYFDSSALVKLLVDEPGSDLAADIWHGADVVVSSRIAYAEVRAALAAAGRRGDLDPAAVSTCRALWDDMWAAVRAFEVTPHVVTLAGDLADAYALSGADAIHLASALHLRSSDLVVAVWDRRLHLAAESESLAVAPSTLGRAENRGG